MQDRAMLTAAQVADRLAIGRNRAYELIRTDVIPAVRIGRYIRVDPAALERWIEGGGTRQDAF